MAAGLATVAVINGTASVATGLLELESIAPTIFTANQTGTGVPAAQIQRVHADGTYDYENVFETGSGGYVASPIAFNGDTVYLILYGTGFDSASTSGTSVTIAQEFFTTNTTVVFAGAQGQFAGLDQIDAQLPVSLARRRAGYRGCDHQWRDGQSGDHRIPVVCALCARRAGFVVVMSSLVLLGGDACKQPSILCLRRRTRSVPRNRLPATSPWTPIAAW